MWVVKQPKRYDFCGCPPCRLCYDWVEPREEPVVEVIVETITVPPPPVVVDGVDFTLRELLGEGVVATPEQRAAVVRGLEEVHKRNLLMLVDPEKPADGGAAAKLKEEEEHRWIAKGVGRLLRDARRAEGYKPREVREVLDNLDPEEVKKRLGEGDASVEREVERAQAEAKSENRMRELEAARVAENKKFYERIQAEYLASQYRK